MIGFARLGVAPEKAVFRPALPLRSLPGLYGADMTKISYSDQLRSPRWQQKRLEVFDAYGFKCNCCEAREKMLHVHHKRYVKGRMAWDYDIVDFEVLCEDCHEEAHEAKKRLDEVVAQFPSVMWDRLADLLVGYGREYVAADLREGKDPAVMYAGEHAWQMGNLAHGEHLEALDAFNQLGPDGYMAALREGISEAMRGG